MSIQIPDGGPTCRGSMALGSGCGRCERCRAELSRMKTAKPLTDTEANVMLDRLKDERLNQLRARERSERIATAALQGLLASGWESKNRPEYTAVYYADALIAELDKGQPR